MTKLHALYPDFCSDTGVADSFLSMSEAMQGPDLAVRLYVNASSRSTNRPFTKNTIPPIATRVFYKWFASAQWVSDRTQLRCVRACRPGDVASLWPGVSIDTYKRLRDKGVITVVEMINCHNATSKTILDDAYGRLGWPNRCHVSDHSIKTQQACLDVAGLIFSPSPAVTQSLHDSGVAPTRILQTSRGWSPQRFPSPIAARTLAPAPAPTFVFVGRGCVRKGLHLLLCAWRKARIEGRLVLAGRLDDEIAEHFSDILAEPNVIQLGFVHDMAPVYDAADIFALPALEEGSPKAMYEAMGCGLPCLLTPMAAGCVARHRQEAFLIDPYDRAAWTEALQSLATDTALRKRMSDAAAARAQTFTWDRVGRRRREQLQRAIASLQTSRNESRQGMGWGKSAL